MAEDSDPSAADNLNPAQGEEREEEAPGGGSLNLPAITVFSNPVLRQLLIISVFAIFFDIVQLICQVCLTIQSRHLITSIISSFSFCWTILLVLITGKWIVILSRNKIEIIKRGKSLIACSQGLSIINLVTGVVLLFLEDSRGDEWKDISVQWLVGSLVCCSIFNIIIFCIIISFVVRGQKEVHRVVGAWLWMAIQRQLQRQQVLIGENRELRDYLSSIYEDGHNLQYSSAAA